MLLLPSGDQGIGLVWDNHPPTHPPNPKFWSECEIFSKLSLMDSYYLEYWDYCGAIGKPLVAAFLSHLELIKISFI